ncbi:MAG TPA: transporter substrate-binding domain-containing protein [Tissierellaceae bacterium]
MKFSIRNNIIKIFILLFVVFISVIGLSRYFGLNFDKNTTLTEEELEWLENNVPLVYAADRNAPPLRYVDEEDGQYKGVLIDYIHYLSIELGTKIELKPLVWEDVMTELVSGNADMCDMFASEERSKKFLFSKPIYNLRGILAVNSELTDEIKSLDDLKGKTMAMQKEDYASEYLSKNYPEINQYFVNDLEEALLLVAEGKAAATLGDEPVIIYQIDKHNLHSDVTVIDKPIYENQVVFAIPKSKPELIPILNKAINSMNKKNVLEKIQQKWFRISTPIVTYRDLDSIKGYIALSILIVLVVLGLFAIWNYSLKSQIKVRTKELEDSRNELQAVFDGMTEYMLVLDESKNIKNINRGFLKELGKDKSQVLGTSYRESLGDFATEELDYLVDKALEEGNYITEELQINNYIYQVSLKALNSINSSRKYVLIFLFDITNEKISANKLLQANKMLAIGELAAGIAHEIRNPLGIIRNHSYIIKNSNNNWDIVNKSLGYIDSAVARASRIIDNLLNFSRISGDYVESTNMYSFIENILELQNKTMQKHNIEYEIICNKGMTVIINQESLKHILINLISNAIDAIENGGKITIKAYEDGNNLAIECTDTGIGIAKENLEKIFNPFYTTKEPGKGTGLGLYIVYNEVKKLNGDITVESVLGEGTTFKVVIPLEKEVA